MNYLIDTDILVDWLRGKKFAARFLREAKGVFYYSSITRKELLTGCRDTAEIVQVQNLLRTTASESFFVDDPTLRQDQREERRLGFSFVLTVTISDHFNRLF